MNNAVLREPSEEMIRISGHVLQVKIQKKVYINMELETHRFELHLG